MMTTEEYALPGTIHWEGRIGEDHIDVSIQCSPGKEEIENNVPTLSLVFVTGNNVSHFVGITPADMLRLGKWIQEIAEESIDATG